MISETLFSNSFINSDFSSLFLIVIIYCSLGIPAALAICIKYLTVLMQDIPCPEKHLLL